MTWLLPAGALAVVLALASAAWLLRRSRGLRIETPDEAVAAAEAALPGFRAVNAVVSIDGAAALVAGADRRLVVCRRRGARLAALEVSWTAIRATADGLLVDTGERSFGAMRVAGVDALDVRRLSASTEESRASHEALAAEEHR